MFKRYNRNTKPLEKHEIAMATYFSRTSQYISKFIYSVYENNSKGLNNQLLSKVYNITEDRKDKQKNHQELCIILSILEYGPDIYAKDGIEVSTNYLKRKSMLFKNDDNENIEDIESNFRGFNEFILTLSNYTEYPFSTNIYKNTEKRMAKYHIGISMVLSIVSYYFDVDIDNPNLIGEIRSIILDSPLGDIEYNASSTNTRNIMTYLTDKKHVFSREYASLKLRRDPFSREEHLLRSH